MAVQLTVLIALPVFKDISSLRTTLALILVTLEITYTMTLT
jgi:hypothetical protein